MSFFQRRSPYFSNKTISSGGGTTTPQALNATQAQSVTVLQKSIGWVRVIAQSASLVLSKSIARARATTQAQALYFVKQVNKLLYPKQGMSALLTTTRVILNALSTASQASVAFVTKSVGKLTYATQSQAGYLKRTVNKLLYPTQGQAGYLQKTVNKLLYAVQSIAAYAEQLFISGGATQKALFATQASVATIKKSVGWIRIIAQAQALYAKHAVATTLFATQTPVVYLTKQVNKLLYATNSMVATLSTVLVKLKTLIAMQAGALTSFVKQTQPLKLLTQAQPITVFRKALSLNYYVSQAQSLYDQCAIAVKKFATQGQTATLTAIRAVLKTLLAVQSMTAYMVKTALLPKITSLGQTVSQRRTVQKLFVIGQDTALTLRKALSKTIRAVQAQVVYWTVFVPNRQRYRNINRRASRSSYTLQAIDSSDKTLIAREDDTA